MPLKMNLVRIALHLQESSVSKHTIFFRESNTHLCSIFSMQECNAFTLDVKAKGSKIHG